METKTAKALALFKSGSYKGAFALFATFKSGFTIDERRALRIAYETLAGHGAFYQQLGIDTQAEIAKSKKLINVKYKEQWGK